MRWVVMVTMIVAGSLCLLYVLDALCGERWMVEKRSGQRGDCVPHMYMSGSVEVRGHGMTRYVVYYTSLSELAELLPEVERDARGEGQWMGRD